MTVSDHYLKFAEDFRGRYEDVLIVDPHLFKLVSHLIKVNMVAKMEVLISSFFQDNYGFLHFTEVSLNNFVQWRLD